MFTCSPKQQVGLPRQRGKTLICHHVTVPLQFAASSSCLGMQMHGKPIICLRIHRNCRVRMTTIYRYGRDATLAALRLSLPEACLTTKYYMRFTGGACTQRSLTSDISCSKKLQFGSQICSFTGVRRLTQQPRHHHLESAV